MVINAACYITMCGVCLECEVEASKIEATFSIYY